jgi:peptidoglycan-N-acetylglucosamine deacetylase
LQNPGLDFPGGFTSRFFILNFAPIIMKPFLFALVLILSALVYTTRAQIVSPNSPPKKIALTFDACMTNGMVKKLVNGTEKSLYNAEIVDYLKQEKIAATIFITGLWAEKYPEAVREIASDRLLEIGNHSYSHRSYVDSCFALPVLPENEKDADIQKTQDIIFKLTGQKPVLFRFPGGCHHPSDVSMVKAHDLKVVGWTFPSGDAFNPDTNAIVKNVLQKAKAGAIVVFHLSGGRYAPKTAEVIREIIPELKKRGFEFVTVSDLYK